MVNRVFGARSGRTTAKPPRGAGFSRIQGGCLRSLPGYTRWAIAFPTVPSNTPGLYCPGCEPPAILGRLNASRTTVVPSEAGPKSSCSPSPVNGGSFIPENANAPPGNLPDGALVYRT